MDCKNFGPFPLNEKKQEEYHKKEENCDQILLHMFKNGLQKKDIKQIIK